MTDLWSNLPRDIASSQKGERIVYQKTAQDTGGAYTEYDHYMEPGQGFSPTHIHEDQTQEWKILAGTAAYVVDGVEKMASAGETVVIPPGAFHIDPWNKDGSETLHMMRKISPEGGSQLFFVTWFALACDESPRLTRPGYQYTPLQVAVVANALPSKSFTSDLPIWMQKLGIPVLAFIGWLMGIRARYPDLEKKYFSEKN
jgi:mannose-6-phosphate isomerase-like protein (cupin superfamily)